MGMTTDPRRRPATPGELVERLRAGWAAALPTGVVTFCLSGIENSAAMWEAAPAAMAEALVRHDELIADCMAGHGGRFTGSMGEGDATVSVFDSASAAVAGALAATHALAVERWPGDLRIRAQFGLHTGEADRRGTGYVGPAINLAVRLRGEAGGGQILLTSVTADLVARHLPASYSLVDLGRHRLEGVAAPERIHALKGPWVSAPMAATDCPYRGLVAFEAADRHLFFGREEVVSQLIGRVAPARLLAVVGASGSGKSSILQAGIIAAALAGEIRDIRTARLLTPGPRPDLQIEDDPAELIVVDQFEELFTLCDDAQLRLTFIDALLSTSCAVVLGMRADMYGRLGAHPELARAVSANQLLLGAMTGDELERAVVEPAHLAGLHLEPGLVELAVREVAGEPGALPLLSHALRATWERRDGRTLTVEGYRESGGVGAAVARTADELLAAAPPERQQLIRNVFVRLTDLGEDSTATRRRVRTDELVPEGVSAEEVNALLERLADARLVTLGEGSAELAHEVLISEWPTLHGWLEEDREGLRLRRQLGDAARMWDVGGREPSDLYRGTRLVAATDWTRAHRPELNAIERGYIEASAQEAGRERRRQLRANRRLRALLAGAVTLLVLAVLAGVVALIQRHNAQGQALTSDAERVGAQALTEQNVDRAMLLGVTAVRLQNRVETRSDLLAVLQRNPALTHFIRPLDQPITAVDVSPDGQLLAVGDVPGDVRFLDLATWRQSGAVAQVGTGVAPGAMSFSPDGRTLMVVTIYPVGASLQAIDVATHTVRVVRTWGNANPHPPLGSHAVAYSPDGRSLAVSIVQEAVEDGTPTAAQLISDRRGNGACPLAAPLPDATGAGGAPHRLHPGGRARHLRPARRHHPLGRAKRARAPALQHRRPAGRLRERRRGRARTQHARRRPDRELISVSARPADRPPPDAGGKSVDGHDQRHRVLSRRVADRRRCGSTACTSGMWLRARSLSPSPVSLRSWRWTHMSRPPSSDPRTEALPRLISPARVAWDGRSPGTAPRIRARGSRWDPVTPRTRGGTCWRTTQSDGAVVIVDLQTGRPVKTLPARDGSVADAVSFLPGGHTLVDGGNNGRVTLWDLATWRPIRTFHLAEPVQLTAPSPDGRLLAVQTQSTTSSTSHVAIVRLASGRVVMTFTVPQGSGGLEFTPDGRELIALGCCVDTSDRCGPSTSRTRRVLFERSFTGSYPTAAVNPRSGMIALGGEKGEVLFLDPRTGRAVRPPLLAAERRHLIRRLLTGWAQPGRHRGRQQSRPVGPTDAPDPRHAMGSLPGHHSPGVV